MIKIAFKLQLMSNYNHVIIIGLESLLFFQLQPLLGIHDYSYDYRY
jgi:hypothetical protein